MPEFAGSELPFGRVPLTAQRRARVHREGAQGPEAGTSKGDGWRRSVVDERVLVHVGKFGALSMRQVALHFYGEVYETARRRVGFMVQAGLLTRADNLRWAGPILFCTAAGMVVGRGWGGPELRAWVPSDDRMLHRLLVADEAIRLTRRGVAVVSERQCRSLERALDDGAVAREFAEFSGVNMGGAQAVRASLDAGGRQRWWAVPVGGGDELHWADYVAVVGGRLIAVEVELAVKNRARTIQLLYGYQRALSRGHISQVLWLVTPDVQTELEGRRGKDGQWEDGLLQRFGFLRAGVVPDWSVKGQPMVVRRVRTDDQGLEYALSQRVVPPSFRSSFAQWKTWRAEWESTEDSADFEAWLMRPDTVKQLRLDRW